MPPFVEKPEGFSSDTLQLLDTALNRLWLEQVAIGAAMNGTPLPAELRALLDRKPIESRKTRTRGRHVV